MVKQASLQPLLEMARKDFLETEVFPIADRIDAQEEGLMRELLEKSGELGLLGIAIPEEYEGFGQNFITTMYASEIMGSGYSYAVAYSCHTGIGTLPILYYGNEEQRAKYIPKLANLCSWVLLNSCATMSYEYLRILL